MPRSAPSSPLAGAASDPRDRRLLPWRLARPEDAEAMAGIYNETIRIGGHSPQLGLAAAADLAALVWASRRGGWPMWVLQGAGRLAAWGMVQPMAWGQQVCRHTGEFSVYVARDWYGSAAAMQSTLLAYELAPAHGFELGTCWILATNLRSLQVARACGMACWGRLPGSAQVAGRPVDVCIWGASYSDPRWTGHMDRLRRRITARSQRQVALLGPA